MHVSAKIHGGTLIYPHVEYTVGFHNNDPLDPYDQMLGVSWVASVALLLSAVWYGANAQGTMEQQVKVEQLALTDPVKAAQEVLKFHGIFSPNLALWAVFNNISGHGDEQVPWGRGAFYRWDPWTIGGTDTGYFWLPREFNMFKLNRTFVIACKDGKVAKSPFYVNKEYDPKKIERAVIFWPGKWRDSWRYANYVGNAYHVAQKYPELDVKSDNVLIILPAFMNEKDESRHALHDDEISFHGTGWSVGGTVRQPREFKHLSSFDVMDKYIDMLMDKNQFPNLKKIVVGGHSMGAQASLRYAFLRDKPEQDHAVKFWIGNPGSYVWLNDKRPFSTNKCRNYNSWPYGISDPKTIPSYARHRAGKNGSKLVENFLKHRVHFAVSQDDNGQGVSNCAGSVQGPTRICRAAEWIVQHGNTTEYEWPDTHTVNFLPGVSHQDYPTLAYYGTIKFLFSPCH